MGTSARGATPYASGQTTMPAEPKPCDGSYEGKYGIKIGPRRNSGLM